jgi:hypothetical protein
MKPTNQLVNPMLTDFYQITMAYAYWKAGVHEEEGVFDLFFRKNPFGGEFAIYAGLEEKLRLFENFHFTDDHIAYLKNQMPQSEKGFFDWLKSVDCSRMKIYSLKEGTIAYPRVPLMRVQGPIAVAQLNLVCEGPKARMGGSRLPATVIWVVSMERAMSLQGIFLVCPYGALMATLMCRLLRALRI